LACKWLVAALSAVLMAALGLAASPAGRPSGLLRAALVPNDTFFSGLTWPAKSADLMRAWDLTMGTSSVTIAVLDTGVSPVPDLAGALVPGHDFIRGGNDTTDDNGHGTQVASVAAARTGNGMGIAGACGRCSIMPVKVLDANGVGNSTTVAQGIDWAVAHGANVINLSMATTGNEQVLTTAISAAVARGVTVVIAAGNSGSDNPSAGGYPAAGSADAIRVGAIAQNNTLYSWSNRGSWVDIAAPGSAEAATAQGTYFLGVNGTSVAAPFVSGVVGLLLSENPSLTPAAVKALLEATGKPVAGLDVASGKRLDAYAALVGAASAPLAAHSAP
jgi:subtilisin family serine protease